MLQLRTLCPQVVHGDLKTANVMLAASPHRPAGDAVKPVPQGPVPTFTAKVGAEGSGMCNACASRDHRASSSVPTGNRQSHAVCRARLARL